MANELCTLKLNEKQGKKHHKWHFSSIFYVKFQKIPEKYQFWMQTTLKSATIELAAPQLLISSQNPGDNTNIWPFLDPFGAIFPKHI